MGIYNIVLITYDNSGNKGPAASGQLDLVPPAAVSDFNVIYDSNSKKITVSWAAPSDEDFDYVEISNGDNIEGKFTEKKGSVVISAEKPYLYNISAVVYDKSGNKSDISSHVVDLEPPAAIEDLKAFYDHSSKEIVVSWKVPDNDFAYVEIFKDGKEKKTVEKDSNTLSIKASEPKEYKISAIPYDESGNKGEVSSTTVDLYPPKPVSNLKKSYNRNDDEILLSWTEPKDRDFAYVKILKNGEEAGTAEKGCNSFVIKENEHILNKISIISYDNSGNMSVPDDCFVDLEPAKPVTELSAAYNKNTGNIDIIWKEPDDADFVYVKINRDGNFMGRSDKGNPSFSFEVTESVIHNFEVFAYDKFGNESPAVYCSVDLELPDPVTDFDVAYNGDTRDIKLSWVEPVSEDFAYVDVLKNGNSIGIFNKGTDSVVIKDDGPYVYTFKVIAYDYSDNRSVAVTEILDIEPPAPVTGLSASYNGFTNEITVSWAAPSDEDFDYVKIKRNGKIEKERLSKDSSSYIIKLNELGIYNIAVTPYDLCDNEGKTEEVKIDAHLFDSFEIPVTGTVASGKPVTAIIKGINFNNISSENLDITCKNNSSIVKKSSVRILDDNNMEITFTIPKKVGDYNVNIKCGVNEISDFLTLKKSPPIGTVERDEKGKAMAILAGYNSIGCPFGIALKDGKSLEWADGFGLSTSFDETLCIPSKGGVNSAVEATFEGDFDGEDNWDVICSKDKKCLLSDGTLNEDYVKDAYPLFYHALTYGINHPDLYSPGSFLPYVSA